jgi:hypothetical protein
MQSQSLKLVNDRDPDALPFNRRACPRHSMSGHVTALRSMTDASAVIKKICSLQLLNMSDTGLGALSVEALDLDSRVTVLFPPHGPERGFDAVGRVVRCVRRDSGHEIGICFEERAAA